MSFETIFFDLDDTLYPSTSGIWQAIGDRMDIYITQKLGVAPEQVKTLREELFYQYGTTLRGLSTLYGIDESDFLEFVHDIPIENYLQRDPVLREILSCYSTPKIVFTNANRRHAERVLSTLGIDDLFSGIIDIEQISPYCKPLEEAYQKAIQISGIEDPSNCVVIDDSLRNLKTANELGFYTIQVGHETRTTFVDAAILTISELPDVIPMEIGIPRE
jgi:pyrimidine 5'-nucleotidase